MPSPDTWRIYIGIMPPRGELTRRGLLGGAAAIAGRWAAPAQGQAVVYAYVGCYTTAQRYARGDGIHVYRVNPDTGAWTHVQHLGGLVNPSFLVVGKDVLGRGQRSLYSVHGDESYATSFSIDRETGHLRQRNRVETGGRNGVHQAVDPSGRFLLVANYTSGSVAVLPIAQDGTLAEPVQVVALQGQPGPHRIEQTSSHPHHIVFDPSGRFVIVPDKGLDRIFVFRFDPAAGKLTATEQGAAIARAGSGPRHAAFHPTLPVAWVVNEIGNTIATCYWEAEHGSLRLAQILPLLPAEYTGESTGAEIAVSTGGRFVYCSNRGHDSIAIFSANPKTGLLTPAGWVSSGGRTPRFIGFDPSRRFLYAANEQSDTVALWRADAIGRLTPAGEVVRNASPVTIAFASGEEAAPLPRHE